MSIKVGSKYSCSTCKSEFIVMKTNPKADLVCCDKPLETS